MRRLEVVAVLVSRKHLLVVLDVAKSDRHRVVVATLSDLANHSECRHDSIDVTGLEVLFVKFMSFGKDRSIALRRARLEDSKHKLAIAEIVSVECQEVRNLDVNEVEQSEGCLGGLAITVSSLAVLLEPVSKLV